MQSLKTFNRGFIWISPMGPLEERLQIHMKNCLMRENLKSFLCHQSVIRFMLPYSLTCWLLQKYIDDSFFSGYPSPSFPFLAGITAVQGSKNKNSLRQDVYFLKGMKARNLDYSHTLLHFFICVPQFHLKEITYLDITKLWNPTVSYYPFHK